MVPEQVQKWHESRGGGWLGFSAMVSGGGWVPMCWLGLAWFGPLSLAPKVRAPRLSYQFAQK